MYSRAIQSCVRNGQASNGLTYRVQKFTLSLLISALHPYLRLDVRSFGLDTIQAPSFRLLPNNVLHIHHERRPCHLALQHCLQLIVGWTVVIVIFHVIHVGESHGEADVVALTPWILSCLTSYCALKEWFAILLLSMASKGASTLR